MPRRDQSPFDLIGASNGSLRGETVSSFVNLIFRAYLQTLNTDPHIFWRARELLRIHTFLAPPRNGEEEESWWPAIWS